MNASFAMPDCNCLKNMGYTVTNPDQAKPIINGLSQPMALNCFTCLNGNFLNV